MNKNVNKKILIILLIVAILLLGGLGYWTYKVIQESSLSDINSNISLNSKTNLNSNTNLNTNTSNTNSNSKTTLKIYMINIGDGGKEGVLVGCGDSAVAVQREVPQTQAVLKAAIEQLISIKEKDYGLSGYYNALYRSNLTLDSVSITNGKAVINLSGTVTSAGACEDPRIIAQFEQTAKQFSSVKDVEVLVNGKNLKEILAND